MEDMPLLEPENRCKGYFARWLDTPLTVRLAKDLWRVTHPDRRRAKAALKDGSRDARLPGVKSLPVPETPGELQENPGRVCRFRSEFGLHQAELARALGITRQTLSRYERGLQLLPEEKARRIIEVWQGKIKSRPIQ